MQTKAENLLNPYRYHLSSETHKRLRWLYITYYEHNGNVSKAARKIGISRQWLSTLKNIFEKHNRDPRSLEPDSKAPHSAAQRNRISPDVEAAILTIRDAYHWGKEKIAYVLKRDYSMNVHPSTVNRYLKKHGRVDPKISKKNFIAWKKKKQREGNEPLLKVKHRPPRVLKDYAPGALIEKDMKFVLKMGQFTNIEKYKAKENFYYQHTEIDSFTRMRTIELVKDAGSDTALKAHIRSLTRFPFPVACVNTDNGGENEKEFSSALQEQQVFHFYSSIGTPTDNPRVERSHLTDDVEFYKKGNTHKTFEEQQAALKKWEHTYNYIRPHQALGYLTPIEFYNLWKKDKDSAYNIKDTYNQYLTKQRKRLGSARSIKRQEQIETLMNFIDAKLTKKSCLDKQKQSLINCQLCSWT